MYQGICLNGSLLVNVSMKLLERLTWGKHAHFLLTFSECIKEFAWKAHFYRIASPALLPSFASQLCFPMYHLIIFGVDAGIINIFKLSNISTFEHFPKWYVCIARHTLRADYVPSLVYVWSNRYISTTQSVCVLHAIMHTSRINAVVILAQATVKDANTSPFCICETDDNNVYEHVWHGSRVYNQQ